jgi:raffinose/stachyose/melibiose transport system substrate-binding protein
MSKKLFTIMLVVAIVLTALTGCSSAAKKDPVIQESTTTTDKSLDKATDKPKDVKLHMVYWHPEQKDIMEKINANFSAEHPGITVELELVPADQYDKILKVRMLGNDGPDVFMYFGGSVYQHAKDGYFGDITNESFMTNILPTFLGSVSSEGKTYAVPLNTSASAVFYNKQVFKDAGITAPPKTYKEFLEICEKIKKSGRVPIARGAKDAWTGLIETVPLNADFVMGKNENFQADRFNDKVKFADNVDLKNFFAKYIELVDKGYIEKGVLGMNHSQAIQSVADGKSAMLLGISVFYSELKAANKDAEFGYFPLPDENGKITVVGAPDKAIGYWPKTKNPEAAKQLLAFYASPEINKMYCEASQMLPTIKGVNVNLDAPLQEVAKDLVNAKTVFTWLDGPWPLTASDVFRQKIQDIHAGKKDIALFLEDMDVAYDKNKGSVSLPPVK